MAPTRHAGAHERFSFDHPASRFAFLGCAAASLRIWHCESFERWLRRGGASSRKQAKFADLIDIQDVKMILRIDHNKRGFPLGHEHLFRMLHQYHVPIDSNLEGAKRLSF